MTAVGEEACLVSSWLPRPLPRPQPAAVGLGDTFDKEREIVVVVLKQYFKPLL